MERASNRRHQYNLYKSMVSHIDNRRWIVCVVFFFWSQAHGIAHWACLSLSLSYKIVAQSFSPIIHTFACVSVARVRCFSIDFVHGFFVLFSGSSSHPVAVHWIIRWRIRVFLYLYVLVFYYFGGCSIVRRILEKNKNKKECLESSPCIANNWFTM